MNQKPSGGCTLSHYPNQGTDYFKLLLKSQKILPMNFLHFVYKNNGLLIIMMDIYIYKWYYMDIEQTFGYRYRRDENG